MGIPCAEIPVLITARNSRLPAALYPALPGCGSILQGATCPEVFDAGGFSGPIKK